MKRLQVVLGHLSGRPDSGPGPVAAPCAGPAPASFSGPSADDVVVVHGRRTAIAKAGRGGFKDTTPDELLAAVLTAVLRDVGLPPGELGDICVGNVLQPGAGAVMARIAQFLRSLTLIPRPRVCSRLADLGPPTEVEPAWSLRSGDPRLTD